MAYYNSKNVSVFPSTNRNVYPQGKLTSESNFINIINSLVSYGQAGGKFYDSYVIGHENGHLKVVIHGYYFDIAIASVPKDLYLSILVENNVYGQLVSWENLNPALDSSPTGEGDFRGLNYTTGSAPEKPQWADDNYIQYTLHIRDYDNHTDEYRFNTNAIYYTTDNIDGRVLSDDLAERQYKVIAGDGLEGTGQTKELTNTFKGNNKISIAKEELNKLRKLNGKGFQDQVKIVYFDNDGIAQESKIDRGNTSATLKNNTVIFTTDVYLNSGSISTGRSVYASKDNPDPSIGKIGDVWLKYAE